MKFVRLIIDFLFHDSVIETCQSLAEKRYIRIVIKKESLFLCLLSYC